MNQPRRVKLLTAQLDTSHPFNPTIIVTFTSLKRFIRYANYEERDIPQVEEYLLHIANEPHLTFDELTSAFLYQNQK